MKPQETQLKYLIILRDPQEDRMVKKDFFTLPGRMFTAIDSQTHKPIVFHSGEDALKYLLTFYSLDKARVVRVIEAVGDPIGGFTPDDF